MTLLKFKKLTEVAELPVKFDDVLLLKDENQVVVGNPKVENAYVEGTIREQGKDKKIIVFFYRHKTRNRKKQGHGQPYTLVKMIELWEG